MDVVDSDAEFSVPLYRQHRGLDHRGSRPPALARLRLAANAAGLFDERLGRERLVHSDRIHGHVHRAEHSVHHFDLARSRAWTRLSEQLKTMETLWFILVALMLVAYVVLDGFDIGAGVISPFVARNHDERRLVLRAIGPVWDGNEVWLIAAGGALFFAFPLLYASSFSGFYLPLMIVLWLLMMRGIGIELRHHVHDPLWWTFFDFVFSAASLLLAIFFGAAIGNVVRGVPLDANGYFFEPLWTNFRVGTTTGILDWYTLITGILAFVTLTVHGAHYIALKTEGELNRRSQQLAKIGWWFLILMTLASLSATLYVRT